MKTLLLQHGDLVVSRRDYVEVTGTGKVAQDLRCALLEPLGNDRFHPGWGSTIDQFVSAIANEETRILVQSEVQRVISNYAAVQRDKVEADINSSDDTRFTTDEIVSRIEGLTVKIVADTILVNIQLRTVSGEVVVLTEAVSGG